MDTLAKADKVTRCFAKLAREYKDEGNSTVAVLVQEANNRLPPESKAKLYDILMSAD